jgi:hypothetical protein
MPAYADLFEDDKLFNKSIAMPIALGFPSVEQQDVDLAARIAVHGPPSMTRATRPRNTSACDGYKSRSATAL